MTIELGFGWFTLPDGEEIGIVDVPGHRDFIENMLSGIGGIDAALLVIAADEGVMPQTREHLAILDLLQIQAGLIVLTKTDLAPDSDWLALLEADIRSVVLGTSMQDAAIVRVSARTRSGLDDLILHLANLLKDRPARMDLNRPRLPVDRVFSMSGFGTVATGTLSDGHFSVGDEVEILPAGVAGRIRGLQTHKKKEEMAAPGSRTAVNIAGVDTEQIRRGDVIAHPGQYQPTRRIDARLRLLKDVSQPLKHSSEVKFFTGASESMGTVRLLGVEELPAGQEAWVQIELREPVVTVRGDRYILRRPSPGETLGGGAVIDHQPKARHKRFDREVLKSLEARMRGTPADILFEAALSIRIATVKDLFALSHMETVEAEAALTELIQTGRLLALDAAPDKAPAKENVVIAYPHWLELQGRVAEILKTYHTQFPLRRGIPREELKSKLKLAPKLFNAMILYAAEQGLIRDNNIFVSASGFEIRFDSKTQAKIDLLLKKFELNPFTCPGLKEARAEAGEEEVNALIELGILTAVSQDIVFRISDYEQMAKTIRQTLQENGQVTLAETRDLFNTTRKYAQALLEHLDSIGMTVRDGDFRKLRK